MIPVIIGAAAVAGGMATNILGSLRGGLTPREAVANAVADVHATVTLSAEPRIRQWEAHNGPRPSQFIQGTMRELITPYPTASASYLAHYLAPGGGPLPLPLYPLTGRGQLFGMMETLEHIAGGELAAEVLATLSSFEGGRLGGGTLRRFNPGNFRWNRSRDAAHPAFFMVDSINSPGFYPAFDNWAQGCQYWVDTVFHLSNYRGALESARAGNLREFFLTLGRGRYAASYAVPDAALPRYVDRVKAKALPGACVRAGTIPQLRFNSAGVLEKLRAGSWVRA